MEIYHITHIDNLSSILEARGLFANSQLQPNQYTDIAHGGIQDRRARVPVPCAAGGTLHDYVPFYFAPRSPMLYTINCGNVEGYRDGQNPILHLVVDVNSRVERDLSFAFTDGHAAITYSKFYTKRDFDNQDLVDNVIDWDLMEDQYWRNIPEDNDRKRRRQAEFLIHEFCPWDFVIKIGVINSNIQNKVRNLLQQYDCHTPVNVYRNWYY